MRAFISPCNRSPDRGCIRHILHPAHIKCLEKKRLKISSRLKVIRGGQTNFWLPGVESQWPPLKKPRRHSIGRRILSILLKSQPSMTPIAPTILKKPVLFLFSSTLGNSRTPYPPFSSGAPYPKSSGQKIQSEWTGWHRNVRFAEDSARFARRYRAKGTLWSNIYG